ncbi:unnamed protein product [Chondrus crispus]|uniref:CCT domain-containing protein n=1 Tax=Chondrus crispus TaxID=2769 RepID=R7Q836_CHOCR|nr:unnamed protein product [Chondrus crispus]CDF34199.1 unnamed protein product [Chondrus crispus]|eukprot:XP_005714018.1 unnamed protein product [Chondrus crispus]
MPTYVSPAADSADHHRPHQDKHIPPASLASPATSSSPLPHSAHHQQRHVSPNSGYAKVPSNSSPVSPQSPHTTSSSDPKDQGTVPPHPAAAAAAAPVQHPVQHPFFLPSHPHQHPHGMFMIGQHPQMMMPSAPGPMYAPQGMVMFAGPQHPGFPQGMVMPPAHAAHMQHRPQGPVKPETQVERKDRIEHEKQELIREFKKKTREAALVRFRQKRRERRFGKLIRYDCRKKLADARPRVKGRFVRIKDDEDMEQPQVVPGLNR